jgi:hypothetical protein
MPCGASILAEGAEVKGGEEGHYHHQSKVRDAKSNAIIKNKNMLLTRQEL